MKTCINRKMVYTVIISAKTERRHESPIKTYITLVKGKCGEGVLHKKKSLFSRESFYCLNKCIQKKMHCCLTGWNCYSIFFCKETLDCKMLVKHFSIGTFWNFRLLMPFNYFDSSDIKWVLCLRKKHMVYNILSLVSLIAFYTCLSFYNVEHG